LKSHMRICTIADEIGKDWQRDIYTKNRQPKHLTKERIHPKSEDQKLVENLKLSQSIPAEFNMAQNWTN
jgi:hypothetical protein